MVYGLWFMVQGSGFWVRVQGSGFGVRDQGSGFRVQGLGFGVWGLRFGIWGSQIDWRTLLQIDEWETLFDLGKALPAPHRENDSTTSLFHLAATSAVAGTVHQNDSGINRILAMYSNHNLDRIFANIILVAAGWREGRRGKPRLSGCPCILDNQLIGGAHPWVNIGNLEQTSQSRPDYGLGLSHL